MKFYDKSQSYKRSGLEDRVAAELKSLDVDYEYESMKIPYIMNETRKYTPDFILPNGIIIETKGRFTSDDRKKHLLIKDQHPEYDIRFVFSKINAKIAKGSKTTHAAWCEKHGFLYAEKSIPEEWLNE